MPKSHQSIQTARTFQSSLGFKRSRVADPTADQSGCYDPQTITAMAAAYEMACVTFPGANPSIGDRETLAKRILQASSSGISNVGMLCSKGLGSIHLEGRLSERTLAGFEFEDEQADPFNRRLPVSR
jgi:hypothetical protein